MNWKILLFCWTFFLQALNAQNLGAIQSEKYFPNSKDPTRFPIGCSPQVLKTQPGLAVKLYSYGHPVPGCSYITYQYPDFPRSGYKKERKLADITGVNGKIDIDLKPNDPCRVLTGHLPSNYNYPDTLTYTNFTMILYGYFQPKVTGYHTFNLEADDLLFMNLGAGNAFDCCKAESTLDNFGSFQSYSLWGSDYAKANITVFLVSGVYYPIRLFYVNRDNNAVIDFSFTTEFDTERVHDFTSYFFSASDGEQCPGSVNYNYNCADVKSSTILTSSTTVDKQEGNIVPITKTIYEIGVPCDPEQPTQKCPGEFYNPIRDACEPLPKPSQDINSSGSSSSDSFSLPPPYTTTVSKSTTTETDIVSFFPSTDSKGHTRTGTITITLTKPSGEADYTTTITSDGHTITEVVSHITTTDSDGNTVTYTTTMASFDQVGDGVYTSAPPYSQPPVVTTTVTEDDGSSKTVVISYSPSEGEDGVTRTGTTTISTITPSGEADYTTTIDKGNGDFETDLVSHITTKDSNGNPTTIVTTIPLKPSDAGEADYTTTITSDGHTITEVVSHITTTDSDGNTVTYTTTMASFDQVGDGVYTSAPPYSQPPVVTTTVTEDDGSSKTVVISYSPSEGEDGVTRTGTTTISTITPSGEADYTTTIDKGNGDFETDLVSHITTKDSNGNPTTIVTTIPLKPSDAGEADYTTTITSDGHTITEVVSHITTTDSDGNTVTYTTTMASFDQVGDGVYTSAPPYSQPPVATTTVSADTATATVVISYFPSIGDDGVTRTGTTTLSTVSVGGETGYTTSVDRGNGSIETDVISHITTTDSN
ncbi:Flocculation protein FLO1, partial [Nakaseomyces glabratus]